LWLLYRTSSTLYAACPAFSSAKEVRVQLTVQVKYLRYRRPYWELPSRIEPMLAAGVCRYACNFHFMQVLEPHAAVQVLQNHKASSQDDIANIVAYKLRHYQPCSGQKRPNNLLSQARNLAEPRTIPGRPLQYRYGLNQESEYPGGGPVPFLINRKSNPLTGFSFSCLFALVSNAQPTSHRIDRSATQQITGRQCEVLSN
jgi:hypothetical protein